MLGMGPTFVGMDDVIVWRISQSNTRGPDGRRTIRRESFAAFRGVVNPVPGEVLATLPEGERKGDQRRVLTDFDLLNPDEDDREWGEILEIEGRFYEVRDKQTYRRVIPHYEYRVRRLDPASVPAEVAP